MNTKETNAPLQKNQKVIVDITALGSDGQGIGRVDGFVLFVPLALPGEHVEALVIKVTASYAVGKLLNIITSSPQRIEPRCPVFARCGGCQLQHTDYDAQLEFKRRMVADAMHTIGGLDDPDVLPVIGMEDPWHYRNKGIFPVGQGGDALAMGMFAPRSHTIVNVSDCAIQTEAVSDVMSTVREWATECRVPPYDESTGKGILRNVMARHFVETGETLAVVITNGPALPHASELVTMLRHRVKTLRGVVQNINFDLTNVVLGKQDKVLWGEAKIASRLGGLLYTVGSQSFIQVNSIQMERLYTQASDMAGLTGQELVIDAYCGVGTIGQFIAVKAGKVIGIESVQQSVEEARRSASRNNITNVEYICGKAEDVFDDMAKSGVKPDVIVMDPPRKGCDSRFLDAVARSGATKLVYVSCNPATLARDVKHLIAAGYILGSVQPVDMFPQTADVECVALMSRVTE
jgi:23S rRNA (uracil1939-C5)-methyltransferase